MLSPNFLLSKFCICAFKTNAEKRARKQTLNLSSLQYHCISSVFLPMPSNANIDFC